MKKLTLSRDWFTTNFENDNEFDYVLRELEIGSSEEERDTITEIELTIVSTEITDQDFSPVDDDSHKELSRITDIVRELGL